MGRSVLRTPIYDLLGIEYPVLLAGMGPTAGGGRGARRRRPGRGRLQRRGWECSAGRASADALREEIRRIRSLTDKPFGVDLLMPSNAVRIETPAGGGAPGWRSQVPAEYWDAINELKRQFRDPGGRVAALASERALERSRIRSGRPR
jgi:NAD(P)H-dependent flavin oxidoreductase YrpB (nitropropane dioxygenase family)